MDIRALPKAELHCHSDGVLDPAMIGELATVGHSLDFTADELAARYPFNSLSEWTHGYGEFILARVQPVSRWLPLIIERHISRLRAQGVCYAELFVSHWLRAFEDEEALIDAFHDLRVRVDRVAGDGLRVEFVVCVGRGPIEKFSLQVPKIMALSKTGLICGVAIAGDEDGHPIRPWQALIDQLHAAGLGIEIHVGEFAGPDWVREAIEYGRPHRIGHGIRAFEDEALVDALAAQGIHVEFCPTSNLKLGIVDRIENHPIGRAQELGVSFSINTDDPGPFECSMESECDLVRRVFGFDEADFAAVYASSLAAAFGSAGNRTGSCCS